MYGLLLTIHILICLILVIIVLVQSGKSGGMGGIFGGGSNDALFSAPSGSLFVKKLTIGFAIAFICSTLLLTALHTKKTTRSVIQRIPISQ